ncbi:hypothetical protein BDR06DRAFT_1002326 [Suillus hirtellus]|nr:hypothetical protein BDR06DRAFT_1002326 [Suillus hirtellus]
MALQHIQIFQATGKIKHRFSESDLRSPPGIAKGAGNPLECIEEQAKTGITAKKEEPLDGISSNANANLVDADYRKLDPDS